MEHEAVNWGKRNGIPESFCRWFWDQRQSENDWLNRNGTLTDWRHRMKSTWAKIGWKWEDRAPGAKRKGEKTLYDKEGEEMLRDAKLLAKRLGVPDDE